VSAGARIAARYRGTPSDKLRQSRGSIRNPRCQAAIDIVLTERQDAYQAAFDAAQLLLDVTGGSQAKELHGAAMDQALGHSLAGRHLDAEKAMGAADALWDYIQERSDT
jgi:hypothetical protein